MFYIRKEKKMKRKKNRMDMLAQQILAMQEELEEVNKPESESEHVKGLSELLWRFQFISPRWRFWIFSPAGGDAGRLGGGEHSGTGGRHQETSPGETNRRGFTKIIFQFYITSIAWESNRRSLSLPFLVFSYLTISHRRLFSHGTYLPSISRLISAWSKRFDRRARDGHQSTILSK